MKKNFPSQKLCLAWRVKWAGLKSNLRSMVKIGQLKPIRLPRFVVTKYTVRWVIIAATIVCTLFGMLGLGITWRNSSAEGLVPNQDLPGITPQSPNAIEDPLVQSLTKDLDDPRLSDIARSGVEEKIEIASRMATEQAAGASQPQTTKVAPTLEPGGAGFLNLHEYKEGIFDGSEGMIRPSTAQIVNGWQGMYEGHLNQVFAGASAEQSETGILIVFVEDPTTMSRDMKMVSAPGETGKLTIIAVDKENGKITLETLDGKTLYFNFDTSTFQE